jgi:D-aminopeptidase
LRGEGDLEALRRFTIPIVGETYDGLLNDISASVIDRDVVNEAIAAAITQTEVQEGNHGGGTGMISHGYKGGTGTSSRVIPGNDRDYTLGVLVQANYGKKEDLRIGNVPVGALLIDAKSSSASTLPAGGKAVEGSKCMHSPLSAEGQD